MNHTYPSLNSGCDTGRIWRHIWLFIIYRPDFRGDKRYEWIALFIKPYSILYVGKQSSPVQYIDAGLRQGSRSWFRARVETHELIYVSSKTVHVFRNEVSSLTRGGVSLSV
jgi:hypothetical protein